MFGAEAAAGVVVSGEVAEEGRSDMEKEERKEENGGRRKRKFREKCWAVSGK